MFVLLMIECGVLYCIEGMKRHAAISELKATIEAHDRVLAVLEAQCIRANFERVVHEYKYAVYPLRTVAIYDTIDDSDG